MRSEVDTKCKNCGCGLTLHDEDWKCTFCIGHPSSNKECPGYETDLEDIKYDK